jgi:hypothetical protein
VGGGSGRFPATTGGGGLADHPPGRDAVLSMLSSSPFALANRCSQWQRRRAVGAAVAWLADQPGSTWQRWLASSVETAGPGWKQACIPWLDQHGIHARQRLDLLSIGLILMICADRSALRPAGWPPPVSAPGRWPGTCR